MDITQFNIFRIYRISIIELFSGLCAWLDCIQRGDKCGFRTEHFNPIQLPYVIEGKHSTL